MPGLAEPLKALFYDLSHRQTRDFRFLLVTIFALYAASLVHGCALSQRLEHRLEQLEKPALQATEPEET